VRAWDERYRDDGLVVIGAHTPEFGFEHELDDIQAALDGMGVRYPIAVDNDYAVWRAFDNAYWPALYFADAEGRIRHHRFGEEDYERSERVIQQLLAEAGADVERDLVSVEPGGVELAADWETLGSPETYVGYARARGFASPGGLVPDQSQAYPEPPRLELNEWALSGDWTVGDQPTTLNEAGGSISHRFHARDVNLVLGPNQGGGHVRFQVTLDGQPPGPAHGVDVDEGGDGTVTETRLYQLIRQDGPIHDRTFEITFTDPGVVAYVFTFG
jgi:thioredoxin family protein